MSNSSVGVAVIGGRGQRRGGSGALADIGTHVVDVGEFLYGPVESVRGEFVGIDLRDVDQPIGTLSGGERQCVAISRAVYFGAKVLILDEPTAALGVKQSGIVLKYVIQARERGLGVIFITHNPHHAYPVGDRFLLLNRGRSIGYYKKDQVTRDELTGLMAGGSELEQLSHELEAAGGSAAAVAALLEEEAEELGTASHEPSPVTREPRTGNPPA